MCVSSEPELCRSLNLRGPSENCVTLRNKISRKVLFLDDCVYMKVDEPCPLFHSMTFEY